MTSPFPTLLRHPAVRALTVVTLLGALLLPVVPPVAAATSCQVTFTGNATGSRDVTASLTRFLYNDRGRRLCLKPYGIYRVDGIVRITNQVGLHLNGRNATLKAGPNISPTANRRQLYIQNSRGIVILNLRIRGRNPDYTRWNSSRQHESGIHIDGGSSIRLDRVSVRDTYGDGIYIGFKDGRLAPATGVILYKVSIARAGRNGVAIVAANGLLITSSVITDTSLQGIDLEPDLSNAVISRVTVQRSSVRRFGRSGAYTGWAFASNGKAGTVSDIKVSGNTGDRFSATVQNQYGGTHRNITFTGNSSTYRAHAYFTNVTGLTFSGNVNITAHRSNVN